MKKKEIKYKDGDNFKAIIDGALCYGKITINENENIYFCQNFKDGRETPFRKGFDYSWVIDDTVKDVKILSKSFRFPKGHKPNKSIIEIRLNDDYTAIIHKDYIKVGCQIIPKSKILEIIKLMK